METIKYRYILFICLLTTIFLQGLFSQQDVRVKLTDNDINQALNALTYSRSINFGDWQQSFATDGYYINLNSASIHFIAGNQASISAEITFVLILADWLPGNQQQPVTGSVSILGNIIRRQVGTGYKIIFQVTDVNYLSSILNTIGINTDQFKSKMPEIELNCGTSLLPNTVASYFTSGVPSIETVNGELHLFFTVNGPREIKAYNDVNMKDNLGSIEALMIGSYSSPKTFWWNNGETHQILVRLNL